MANTYKEFRQSNFPEFEKDVLKFWKDHDIFSRSVTEKEGNASFTFYEGPPSANGTPGIHHVMARTVKDIFCRFKTLQGYQVKRKGGWDTHGLPVELQVEKELGITKEDIGKKISLLKGIMLKVFGTCLKSYSTRAYYTRGIPFSLSLRKRVLASALTSLISLEPTDLSKTHL